MEVFVIKANISDGMYVLFSACRDYCSSPIILQE